MWLEVACTVLQGISCSLGVHGSGLLWVIFQVLKFRRHTFIYASFLFIYLFLPPALTNTSKMIRDVLKALMYQRLSQNLEFKVYLGIQLSKAGSQRATPPSFVCVFKKKMNAFLSSFLTRGSFKAGAAAHLCLGRSVM